MELLSLYFNIILVMIMMKIQMAMMTMVMMTKLIMMMMMMMMLKIEMLIWKRERANAADSWVLRGLIREVMHICFVYHDDDDNGDGGDGDTGNWQ